MNGKDWIYCRWEKSQTPKEIPLLEKAKNILQKYQNAISKFLLPVHSNQKNKHDPKTPNIFLAQTLIHESFHAKLFAEVRKIDRGISSDTKFVEL